LPPEASYKKQPLLIALRFLKAFAGGPNGEDAFCSIYLNYME